MQLFIKNLLKLTFLFVVLSSTIVFVNFRLINSHKLLPESNRRKLILGDSNTECAINDSVFTSGRNWSSATEPYFYSYLKLKHLLDLKSNIDTLFLSFSPHNVFDGGWLPDRRIKPKMKFYLPLMNNDDFAFVFSRRPIGVLSSFPSIIKKSFLNIFRSMAGSEIPSSEYGGFYNLHGNMLKDDIVKLKQGKSLTYFEITDNFNPSTNQLQYLDKIILLCNKYSVKLFLINTPKHEALLSYPKYGGNEFYRLYNDKYHNICFLDFSNLKLPDEFYGDVVHLNSKGSTYFSSFLEKKGMAYIIKHFNRDSVALQNASKSLSVR
jgi:hypothetical protein